MNSSFLRTYLHVNFFNHIFLFHKFFVTLFGIHWLKPWFDARYSSWYVLLVQRRENRRGKKKKSPGSEVLQWYSCGKVKRNSTKCTMEICIYHRKRTRANWSKKKYDGNKFYFCSIAYIDGRICEPRTQCQ